MSFSKSDTEIVLNIKNLNSIEPFILEKYLKQKGWNEQQKIDDRAIVLSINQESKKYLILLPLDQEIPDFEDRMEEALKTLEFIEQKPISEILANIINPSRSIELQEEILNLRKQLLEAKESLLGTKEKILVHKKENSALRTENANLKKAIAILKNDPKS